VETEAIRKEPAPSHKEWESIKEPRTKHSPAFEAIVAPETLREEGAFAELSRRHKVHANPIYKWKR
jgi:transposase-like protein